MSDPKALADEMIAAVKDFVERRLDPLAARLSSSETRISAILMLLRDSPTTPSAKPDGRVDRVLQLLVEMESRLKELEARPRMRDE